MITIKNKIVKTIMLSVASTFIITNMYSISASAKWAKDSQNNWSWTENETKVVGWKSLNNNWYYFNKDGIMSIGWNIIDGKWYNFNENGHMSIGWINDNGLYYFTNSNGEMQTGTVEIDGKIYTFSNSGVMLSKNSTSSSNNDGHPNLGYVATNSDSLNFRSDATLSSNIIGTISRGSEVKIIDDEKNGFYPVVFNNKKGWVSSQWISFKKLSNTSNETATTYSDTNASGILSPEK